MSPLKLTPFEFFMLQDDLHCRSMTFLIRMEFSGSLKPDCFAAAVQQALPNHPLLCAHISGSGRKTFRWTAAADPRPYLDIASHETPCLFPGSEQIDLARETGLRIWVRHNADSAQVLFQFHHACCDGIGAYRAIEDILCAYDKLVFGNRSTAEARPIAVGDLSRRAQFAANVAPSWARLWRNMAVIPWRIGRFFLESPTQILCPRKLDPAIVTGPLDFPSHVFTRGETTALQQQAVLCRATTNDVLLRELLLTLRDWNAQHSEVPKGTLFRVMVPMSLRTRAHDLSPAANIVSMVSIALRAAQLQDPDSLLSDIVGEFEFIRKWRIDLALNETAALIQALPMPISDWLRHRHKCHSTSVLSNAGKLFARALLPRASGKVVAGGLSLESVASVPPVRPNTSVSFGCHWYAGKLVLNVNYERCSIGSADAKKLLARYVGRIRTFARGRTAHEESCGEVITPAA